MPREINMDEPLNHVYDELTDSYKVSLTIDGITASTWVSSMHLIEGKRQQLKDAVTRMATDALTYHYESPICFPAGTTPWFGDRFTCEQPPDQRSLYPAGYGRAPFDLVKLDQSWHTRPCQTPPRISSSDPGWCTSDDRNQRRLFS